MGEAPLMRTDNPVARAFEFARDDRFHSVSDIRRALEKEGYLNVALHFDSSSLKKQLNACIRLRSEAGAAQPSGSTLAASDPVPSVRHYD